MTYWQKLQDPRWQKKRLKIFERDGFKCLDCGCPDKTLQVHHCHYDKEPWTASEIVLITVCDECHKRRQKVEHRIKCFVGMTNAMFSQQELDEYLTVLKKTYMAVKKSPKSRNLLCDELSQGEEDLTR